jgi:hypothetical protein
MQIGLGTLHTTSPLEGNCTNALSGHVQILSILCQNERIEGIITF